MRKLMLVAVLCLALVVACAGCAEEAATPTTGLQIDGEIGLSATVALTENHITSLVSSMTVLAMTDEVTSGSWDAILPLLSRFKEDQIPVVSWFALPDGSYYTVEKGKTTGNLSDRVYFPKVMAGSTDIGELVVSKSTGRMSMIAVVPVTDSRNVKAALGVSVFVDELSDIIVGELQLPDDMVFYAINEEGVIALHSDPQWLLKNADEVGSETFSAAVDDMLAEKEGSATYEFDGASEAVLFKTSSLTGWVFALGVRAEWR